MSDYDQQQTEAAEIIAWLQPDALLAISTPSEGQAVESMSAAAIAFYREQRDRENMIQAWRLYVLARRRTTELLQAEHNMDVTLAELGFTPMQWHRRKDELKVPPEKVDEYFDVVVAKGWNPSIAGMLRQAGLGETIKGRTPYQRMLDLIWWELENDPGLSSALRRALQAVVNAAKEEA